MMWNKSWKASCVGEEQRGNKGKELERELIREHKPVVGDGDEV